MVGFTPGKKSGIPERSGFLTVSGFWNFWTLSSSFFLGVHSWVCHVFFDNCCHYSPVSERLDSFQKIGLRFLIGSWDGMSLMFCRWPKLGGLGARYPLLECWTKKDLAWFSRTLDSSAVLGMGGFCFSSRAVELSCWRKYLQHHLFFSLEWTTSPFEMSLLLEMFVAPG